MTEKNHQSKTDLKPLTELKGLDFAKSDGLVCDMETGICGPQKQEEEPKK